MSFFRFCWKNEKIDWPKFARTFQAFASVFSGKLNKLEQMVNTIPGQNYLF